MDGLYKQFKTMVIGEYTLAYLADQDESFWLSDSEGNGLRISTKELEELLDLFWEDNDHHITGDS